MTELQFILNPLPDLLPYRPHPDRERVEDLSNQWTRRYLGPLMTRPEALNEFLGQRLALWPGMCYPAAPPERLLNICNWNQYWFFMDDMAAYTEHLGSDPVGARTAFDSLRQIAHGTHTARLAGHEKIFSALFQAITSDMPEQLAARFVADLDDMLDGFEREIELRSAGYVDTDHVDQLIAARLQACGMLWCFDLSEYGLGIDLSNDLDRHPGLRRIRDLAVRQTCLFGEIFSFRKEYFSSDGMNAIAALIAQNEHSLQEAVDILHARGSAAEHEFVAACDAIRKSDLGQRPEIHAYLDEIGHQIAGVTRWELQTPAIMDLNFNGTAASPAIGNSFPTKLWSWADALGTQGFGVVAG